MKYTLSKEELIESLRLWDVPQLNTALDQGFRAEEIVNLHKTDLLLECIVKKSEPLFLRILDHPFDFNKNKFLYLHHAVRNAIELKDSLFVERLLDVMDEENIHKKDPHSDKTALHIACELNLQNSALLLTKKGLSWNDVTTAKQTPLHLLLRNSPYIETSLIEALTDANLNKKDNMDLSCKDIIKSFSFDSDWSAIEQNQTLIKKLKI